MFEKVLGMKPPLVASTLVLYHFVAARATVAGTSSGLIFMNSSDGVSLLKRASHDQPYWQLWRHFATEDLGKCGQTTAAIVLNALSSQGVMAPVSMKYSAEFGPFHISYRYWEDEDVNASECARRATAPYDGSLEQVASFMSCVNGVSVHVTRAANSTPDSFRQTLRKSFESQPLRFVAVNFDRRAFHQAGMGHHSPIAAYDEISDRVLVLDVARYKFPPFWVTVDDMFYAMNATDLPVPPNLPKFISNFSTPRGYLEVFSKFASSNEVTDKLVM